MPMWALQLPHQMLTVLVNISAAASICLGTPSNTHKAAQSGRPGYPYRFCELCHPVHCDIAPVYQSRDDVPNQVDDRSKGSSPVRADLLRLTVCQLSY